LLCRSFPEREAYEGIAKLKAKQQQQKREVVMAATLQYGRERAHLGRSLLNFMNIARDAHTPDLTLGEVGDLLFTAIEVFIGHAFERPLVLSELSRNLEMPRNTVRRKLQRLIKIGLVECIDHHYYMTAKANAPLQREVLLVHLHNMQSAIKEVSKMDVSDL
jgi:IclR helix-turn-helix domain